MTKDEILPATHDCDNGKGKGKGKATDPQGPEAMAITSIGTQTDSMTSRFARSASGLASSILNGAPSSKDIGAIVPTSKATTSSSDVGPAGASRSVDGLGASRAWAQTGKNPQDTFRSSHGKGNATQEESSFSAFLDKQGVLSLDSSTQNSLPEHARDPRPVQNGADDLLVADWEIRDGEEVSRLLDTDYEEMDLHAEEAAVDLSTRMRPTLRQELFDRPGVSEGVDEVDWDNILNFIPDFLLDKQSEPSYVEAQQHMGTSSRDEAKLEWLNQWQGVLNRYTDVVWGDLTILVEEARKEVRELRDGETGDPMAGRKALLRLRQILGHMRRQ